MEVITELFVGVGAGCQGLQQRAYVQLQALLEDSRCGPAARWAAGCNATEAQQHGHFLRPSSTSAAWATQGRRATHDSGHPQLRCNVASAGRFASLTVSGIAAAAETERGSCRSADGSGWQQEQKQQQQQQQQAVEVVRRADRTRRQHDGRDQLLRDMSGTWIRNRESSDSMEDAMNLMRLNGIVRQAVKLVRGVRIEMDPGNFTFTVFSVISWFKVKEIYPMSGEERQFRRRDLRRGGALGRVEPHGQDLRVELQWSDPLGGKGRDHFRLVSEGELHIESVIEVAGQTARYRTVYNRKADRHHRQLQQQQGEQQKGQQGQAGGGCSDARLASASASASAELSDEGV